MNAGSTHAAPGCLDGRGFIDARPLGRRRPRRGKLLSGAVNADPRAVPSETLPFLTRLWFAWLCFFRVLFDSRFAAAVWQLSNRATALPAPPRVAADPFAPGELAAPDEARRLPAPAPSVHEVALPVAPVAASPTSALQLLSLLQREGRLVDFLQQDIAAYPDADVGVAARVVHEGCRRAIRSHATIEPVRNEDEGTRVTLSAGFRADEIKLVGDVKGDPPYAGVLRHRGWRMARLELPQIVGAYDARVLAPAEVELG